MCRAVDKLTPEQRKTFDRLREQLANMTLIEQAPIIDALRDYVELAILTQRPYERPRPPIFPSLTE